MNQPFLITIGYQEFKARFDRQGLIRRIAVLISEERLTLGSHEEGRYQVIGKEPGDGCFTSCNG